MNLIALAIPGFLAFVALEAALSKKLGRGYYRFNDAISNIGCGLVDQLINVLTSLLFVVGWVSLGSFAPVPLDRVSPWTWLVAFVALDVAYYTFHRLSHRVNFLWGAHIVHHQSEDYNLTVSLRQGTVATWVTYAFYLPLALLGIPIEVWLVVHGVFQIYQFLVHTRFVGKLGVLESVFVTPSFHRVHHGRAPDELDTNYGGFLNVWDRMFGSYRTETCEPDYGITTGMESWSPFWANTAYYRQLWAWCRELRGVDKLLVWLAPPEWHPDGLEVEVTTPERFDAEPDPAWFPYLTSQLAVLSVGTIVFLLQREVWGPAGGVAWVLVLLAATWGLMRILEGRTEVLRFELVRTAALSVLAWASGVPLLLAGLLAGASAALAIRADGVTSGG